MRLLTHQTHVRRLPFPFYLLTGTPLILLQPLVLLVHLCLDLLYYSGITARQWYALSTCCCTVRSCLRGACGHLHGRIPVEPSRILSHFLYTTLHHAAYALLL
jgi:hypothetical protein